MHDPPRRGCRRTRARPTGRRRADAGLTPEQATPSATAPGRCCWSPDPAPARPARSPTASRTCWPAAAQRRGEILAVTFSVRAAGELRLRLADLLGEQTARGVTAATFHSVCARLLREHAGAVRPHRRLHDLRPGRRAQGDRVAALRRPARRRSRRRSPTAASPPRPSSSTEIALAKNRLLDPDGLRARPLATAPRALVAAVWRASELELERCNAWSFDDLLVFAVRLLREHPHRLAHLRRRWRWLLVDEIQDTNEAQAALVAAARRRRAATSPWSATTIRLIYRFRGAEPRNILALRRALPRPPRSCSAATSAPAPRSSSAAVACIATTRSGPRRR